jgi:uncharacterized membrane protein
VRIARRFRRILVLVTSQTAEAPSVEPEDAPRKVRNRGAYIEMLVSSILGLVASLVLSIDAIAIAENPDVVLSCDINSKISCTTVGSTWQANLLGFPNAFLGLITEPIVITVALAALGGVRFPRWFMNTAQVFYSIGFVFAYWLFYQAYFVIGALCPWCLMITVTTTLVFTSMTRVNLLDGNLGVKLQQWSRKPLSYGADVAGTLILIAIVAAMVIMKYL